MERLVLDDGTSERASQLHGRLHHPRSVNQALTRRIFIGRTTQEHSQGSSTSCTARRWPCWWRVGGRVCGSDCSDFGRSRAKPHQFSGRVNPPPRIPRSYLQPSRWDMQTPPEYNYLSFIKQAFCDTFVAAGPPPRFKGREGHSPLTKAQAFFDSSHLSNCTTMSVC